MADKRINREIKFTTNVSDTIKQLRDLQSTLDENSSEYEALQVQIEKTELALKEYDAILQSNIATEKQVLQAKEKLQKQYASNEKVIQKNTDATRENAAATSDLTKEVTSNGGAMTILDTVTGGYASRLKNAYEATTLFTKGTIASTIGMKGASVGARALRVALISIGIGIITTAVAFLVANWDNLKKSFTDFLPTIGITSELFDEVKAVVVGVGGAIVDYLLTPIRAFIKLMQGDFRGAIDEVKSGYNVVANYNDAKNKQIARDNQKAMDEDFAEYVENEERKIERARNRGEETDKLERDFLEKKIGYYKKDSEEYKKASQDLENFNDRLAANRKRREETASQDRIRAAQQEAERLKRIEEERIEELKKINEEYRRWQLEIGNLDPSADLIEANNKQIEKLLEAKKKTTVEGEKAIFDTQIEMYKERNKEILNIRDTYDKLLKRDPLADEGVFENMLRSLIVGDQIDYSIDRLSAYRKEIDDFLSSIMNADLKTHFTAESQEMIKTADTNIKYLTRLRDSFNDFTEVNNADFIASLRESQDDLEGWTDAVNQALSDSMADIGQDYFTNLFRLQSALSQGLITTEEYNTRFSELGDARRLRKEEAEQTHSDNLQAIEEKRLEKKRANWEAEVAIVSASANAQAATLDMVLSFMSKEDEERAKATGAYKTLAIATATMDTYAAAVAGYRGAMATFANPIVGNIVGIASMATAISTGIAQINAIRKVKVPGGEGGGGGNSVSAGGSGSISQPNVDFVSSSENQIANTVGDRMQSNTEPIKAYVVTSEISSSQSLERNKIESNSL